MSHATKTTANALPLLVLAGCLLVGFSWWRSQSAAAEATEAQKLLSECRTLAGRIEASRGGSTVAEESRRTEDELAREIDAWRRSVGIKQADLLRIEPLAPRRVDNTSYIEQGARVQIRRLTLPQLASFADHVENRSGQLNAKLLLGDLRLTAPRVAEAAGGDESWQGEFALTYFVYSPKSSR